jgi:hypothetical protein
MNVRQAWITGVVACAALAGPATVAEAGLFSAKGAVIAILAGELYVGEAEGHLNGAGTLAIHSQKDPGLTCAGEFTSSAELGGKGQLRCSDRRTALFSFQRLDMYSGHGVGKLSRGAMSFTYGLTAEKARPYLKLPAGKRLSHDGTMLKLVAVP